MRELAIVMGLIEQDGNYLLQFRNGDPKIGAVNMIGCFGGKIDKGEEPVDAVCRELGEETSLVISTDDAEHLGSVEVLSDHQLEAVKIYAEVFLIRLGNLTVRAKEGQLVRVTAADAQTRLDEMTPGTRAVFEQFVLNKG